MNANKKIIYINNDIENGKVIDWNYIHKQYMKLKPPSHVYKFDIDFDLANLFVIFSKRDTGKTTNLLLHALIAYCEYGVKLEWVRQVADMIKPTHIESMFDTIYQYDYISKITKGKYSAVYYYRKEMYLCNYDGTKGKPKDIDDVAFMHFSSIDDMQSIKSNYTSPNGDLIVLDEFQSRTNRENEFIDFFHIISTIRRHRLSTKIIMMGNTISPFNYYFKEMDITKYVVKMKPNSKMVVKTKRGMNIYLEWVEPKSDSKSYNEKRRINDLQYYGFDNLNSITGGAWDIKLYPHITKELDSKKIVLDNFYLRYQFYNLNLKLCIDDNFGLFVYCRPCSDLAIKNAEKNDSIIFVDREPMLKNEIMGCGKQISVCVKLWALEKMGRFLYSTNDVGEIVSEFIYNFY